MTDKRNIGVRHISDARDTRTRTLKFAQKKMKTKRRMIGLKQSQSPSYHNAYNCHKDFTTPKRRTRSRFNGSYSGDSPNETESPQDIIWDTNSPSQSLNGQGDGRVIEISEIVNRIAPKVEKANEGDSVLQWIGDSAIPCTPEVKQPRVRRVSARHSNVEDLMKLAKQFDINMTRQDKEKRQESTEKINKLNEVQSSATTYTKRSTSVPVLSKQTSCSTQSHQEEAELQALFDGPTQHVSGRLSPPSVNCTPENTSDPVAQDGPRLTSSAIKIIPKNTSEPVAQVSPKSNFAAITNKPENTSEPVAQAGPRSSSSAIKITPKNITEPAAQTGPKSSSAALTNTSTDAPKSTAFDDDWENDDLLNDSFVLEMTQNPVPLNVAQKQSAAQPESCSKKLNFVTKVNPSVSNGRNISSETQQSTNKNSTFTKTLPEVKMSNQSTFRLEPSASAQNITEKLLKTSPVNQVNKQTRSSEGTKQELGGVTKDCGVSNQASSTKFNGVSEEDMKSLFDSDGLWNDEDDDLLFKACDDVEKLSASQELQKAAEESTKLAHDKSKGFVSKAPSSSETNGKFQPQEPTKSSRVFARSNSVPCTSGSSGFKQAHGVIQATKTSSSGLENESSQYGQAQKSSQVKSASGSRPGSVRSTDTSQTGGNASNSHHYTLKRHLSDSMTLTNKVFISSHVTAKCSAAEIEKKKQEAIARRRSRMQASQKNGAPT